MFYSLGCALSWAAATVYIKWAKVTIEPLANAAWQLLFGLLFIAAGTFLFEGYPHLWPIHNETVLAILFVGVFGVGLAHFLWWTDRRAAAGDYRLARLAAGAGDRRHRFGFRSR